MGRAGRGGGGGGGVDPGPAPGRKLKSFFWDRIPPSRVPSTFWATQQPDYELLRPHLRQAEELFQARPSHRALISLT